MIAGSNAFSDGPAVFFKTAEWQIDSLVAAYQWESYARFWWFFGMTRFRLSIALCRVE